MKRIDVLPDDVLLEIFDFYLNTYSPLKTATEKWQLLVHVCQRWRNLVFGSPRRLNLQLICTTRTPAKDVLDVWPALPLIIQGGMGHMTPTSGTDNIIAALGQCNRVCMVRLWDLADRQLEAVLAPMQVPFPELTDLRLHSCGQWPPVISDSFLGGSAPGLRSVSLCGIPFPGLPKLLLSANHLVELALSDIPVSGYISPEAMVAPFSVLPNLCFLSLEFQSDQSEPSWESPSLPPPERSILPALNHFQFTGFTDYLENFVTFIDAPQLEIFEITFFDPIDFDIPQLAQFINRTPTLGARDEAHVQFSDLAASVKLRSRTSIIFADDFTINLSCEEQNWQRSSIEQVCNSSFPFISTVEDLYIEHGCWHLVWKGDAIWNTLWLQLLLPFSAVKNLYLSRTFALGIAAALQELDGGRTIQTLPSLQNIFVEGLEPSGSLREDIEQFVAARRLSGHHIGI